MLLGSRAVFVEIYIVKYFLITVGGFHLKLSCSLQKTQQEL